MATKVHMEALSPTMEEGQIVKWLKSEGDEIANGDVLAEIETDKATMELVARGEGVLRAVLVEEGASAPVGEVIAVIAAEDEDISEFTQGAGGASGADGDEPEAEPTEEATDDEADRPEASGDDEEEDDSTPTRDTSSEPAEDGKRIKASPLARRLAESEGLPLARIEGSGPGGRIVKSDVERAAEKGLAPDEPTGVPSFAPDSEADYEDVPLSQMRKTIAKRLVQSIGPIPHFFLTVDIDMTGAVEARARVNALLESEGAKISYNDIVLKATAMALRKHPECNAHWREDHIRRFNRVHLAVAVAIDDGLITPVVRDAHRKGLRQINAEVRELAGRAREKKLKPEEYTGATFSVSNLGMFGIEDFTAVINPPEAGILAVGGMEERPVVVDGALDIQTRMKVTMSCDHRVIDGAQGSRFLQTLKAILEEPLVALI
ncbi:MAG: pyruvate dehydrogenase complex dihydrolipoamide acetyltransferase [Gemmatimonadota bacterium]